MVSVLSRLLAIALLSVNLFAQSIAPAAAPSTAPPPQVTAADSQRYTRIAQAIDSILASNPAYQRAHVGISVVRLSDGAVVYAHNDQQLFVPASNTKLLTTTAGFALLGPDWKTRTTVESSTRIRKGVLKGDLVLVGRGDPNLSGRVLPYDAKAPRTTPPLKPLESLADQLVAAGLKRVRGSVVGDDTWFAYERWGDSWGQDDLMWEYGAPVSALTLNDNQMFFTIKPGARAGARAIVTVDPFVGQYTIENRILTGSRNSEKHLALDRQPGSYSIKLWGTIPAGSPPQEEALAMEDPAAFAAAAFRNMLIARGVKVDGNFRAHHTDSTTLPITPDESALANAPVVATPLQRTPLPANQPQRIVLAQLESHPLVEDLKVINKVSQNLHVEILMRQLGREYSLLPGTAAGGSVWGGTHVVRQFLTGTVGIAPDEFQYNDGSGMTPHNLVTPAMLTQLLRYARTQPWANQFVNTLPLSGTDGTLEHRFLNTPSAGRVRAKTGSLTEVTALSGYATTLDGEELVLSLLVNAEKIPAVNSHLVDPVVRAVVETQ